MVMAVRKDRAVERVIRRHIDTFLVDKDTFLKLPVRQVGSQGNRGGFIHELQCVEDQRISFRCRANVMGYCYVDEVDKERRGK